MKLGIFIDLLFNNLCQYISLAIIILFIYYFVFSKFIFSIYDPLFFSNIVPSSFATTTVVFLFINEKISSFYFINYLITVIIFYSIFFMFGKRIPEELKLKFKKKLKINVNGSLDEKIDKYFWIFFIVLSASNVFIQLFFYVKTGIPLFMDSRLEVNINGGVVIGVLSRVKPLFSSVSLFMSFYLLSSKSGIKKLTSRLYILFMIVVSLLSGSKSGLIGYIFIFSVYVFYTQLINKKYVNLITSKKSLFIFMLASFSVLFIIHIQQKGDLLASINHLILRFAAFGDGYIYAYPNDIIKKVYKPGLFKFLFGDFLSTFRLISERNVGLGFELSNIIYNVNDSVTGPNPRFNIAGLAYFGFSGSIFIALVSGAIFTLARNILVDAVYKTPSKQVFAYFISSVALNIETDICQTIVNLTTDLFLQSICFICICFFIVYLLPSRKNKISYAI